MIDLIYLTNPTEMQKLKKENIELNFKELEFYKKRIFQTANDILFKKETNKKLVNIFNHFSTACIEHFKFIDKSEIIQKDYQNLKINKKGKIFDINVKNLDVKNLDVNTSVKKLDSALQKKKSTIITDYINIKITNVKRKKTIIPKKRIFDLRDSKYKTKGINCDFQLSTINE